ncbi:MAG: NAD(P)-dependent oxidoreductase, partial [Muribaculaceae bacterium]|nr:NAD(P)-dependent oxidoreductase [Muribaculaceae bacterium]
MDKLIVGRKKRVLVVGAGGFTGGWIVNEGLRRGYEMWAGVRESTSREWLGEKEINFLTLDFSQPESLQKSLESALPEGEKWDYIVYNLGATKVMRYLDFSRINYDYLRYFTTALKNAGMTPDKFLYMSSLSAMGPVDEKGYAPFTEDMIPMPNTKYGASKLKAELWLEMDKIPYIIFRPTGIYGPRDKDYFLMFKSIAAGFDFSVGYRRQLLTFIYVKDLAAAVYDALEHAPVGEVYNISENRSYTQSEFRKIVGKLMNKKIVIPVRMPLWGVKWVSAIAEKIGVAQNKPSTLNRDKYKIMKQRNWNVDISKARRDFGFNPPLDPE